MTTMLARNMQTSHEDLASHVTASSMSVIDPSTADRLGGLGETAMQMLNIEISRQAAMIAYLDNFKLMMVILIIVSPLVFFLKPGNAAPGQEATMAD
jgi:DHA2 family multidrug resistance protein